MDDLIGLFDMDGTLFDYEGALRRDLKLLMAPGEEEPEDLFDESKPYLKARMKLIKGTPGWWRNLPTFELGWDIYRLSEAMGFLNHILTKGPKSHPQAWMEKVQCIADHFGSEANIDIMGKDKSARYGRFLCDDYPEYILGWLKYRPRGLVIMPAHDYNKDFTHPNVIRYESVVDLEKVSKVLAAVRRRKSGQHWQECM